MKHIYLVAACLLTLSLTAAPKVRFAVLADTHVSAPETVYDTIVTQDTATLRDTTIVVPREVQGEALQALAICAADMRSQQLDLVTNYTRWLMEQFMMRMVV